MIYIITCLTIFKKTVTKWVSLLTNPIESYKMALQFPWQGSQHSGSSLSLASTKVCSSMDEGDGPGSEGEEPCETMTKVYNCLIIFIWMLHPKSFLLAELMEDCPQVPASIAERYKVGRMIGDGNFAVVRECVERSTGREYALKIINKSKCRGKVRWFLKTILFSDDWVKSNDGRSSVLHLWLTGTHDPEWGVHSSESEAS